MTLKGHKSPCNANRAVLWLTVSRKRVCDGTVGYGSGDFYRLPIVTMCLSAAVWLQF